MGQATRAGTHLESGAHVLRADEGPQLLGVHGVEHLGEDVRERLLVLLTDLRAGRSKG